ncbi:GrpB family protein [Pantoea stewartii]|uniref:GrpB family protein n=1 Tax=Pantoea stewartii TaxID=66269 RepID=UPI001CF7DDAF|nr:GrpB family protein [Pantoea stewartii]
MINGRQIIVSEYCPEWANHFSAEAAVLAARLGKHLVATHHIGSTAVPGLAAKPIIDILLEVITHDSSDITSALCASGYQARGENGMPGRRYYTKGLQGRRTHHVHAFIQGSPDIIRHLAFRDYLRKYPDIRDSYAVVKYAAQRDCRGESNVYCELKKAFVQAHQQRALALYPF